MSDAPPTLGPPPDGPVRAVFSTRQGGTSAGPFAALNLAVGTGDDPGAVRANRLRLATALGLDPAGVSLVRQVHGREVRVLGGPIERGRFTAELTGWPAADGMTTAAPATPLCVLGADCLPVLAWRRDGRAVGAMHAGWRGLAAGVIESGLAALAGTGPIAAAIGPGIGPCCYEVSADVRALFARRFGRAAVAGAAVDLAAAAAVVLERAGIAPASIWRSGACTACDARRFFSHRRDGRATGRQAGLVWIE